MTTTEILAQAQFLALREQVTPGHPAYEQDFRQLLLETVAHVHEEYDGVIQQLLAVDEDNRATIQTLQALNDDLQQALTGSTARIAQLTATLATLKRQHEGGGGL